MLKKYLTFSHFTLLVALSISAIAAWYSVLGLTAIFAGAVLPIIIMGSVLEVAKITTTVWLHRHWTQASRSMRIYLVSAVIALACLTSMGIFGLLSKAHLDQGLVGGDVLSQIALFDEKIKIQRDNIDAARKALQQMDAQVDARLQRGDSESGAERSVQIRRQQGVERGRLLKEIGEAQKEITKLTDQRAPLASQLRKVEAEVGPVKYIAALIYGDNPDVATLERAVRWVIILIVLVFDPLAIVLILAANKSIEWDQLKGGGSKPFVSVTEPILVPEADVDSKSGGVEIPTTAPPQEELSVVEPAVDTPEKVNSGYSTGNYSVGNYVFSGEINPTKASYVEQQYTEPTPPAPPKREQLVKTSGVTEQVFSSEDEYVLWGGKKISTQALKHLKPGLVVNSKHLHKILWGTEFPQYAALGDIFTRVDVQPHRTYTFSGSEWAEVDRNKKTEYLQNESYIRYIIDKIGSGEYDAQHLTAAEGAEISNYLKQTT